MSSLLSVDLVNYQCGCKLWQPLCRLYFCRHCQALRCGQCVSHEVDCHYCANCLENMPSAEARLKKNKCGNCFDCPSCGNALSIRAASLLDGASGGTTTFDESMGKETTPGSAAASTKKVVYLICGFCRWSTREAGIPDQNMASGNWPEADNSYCKLFNTIQENFRQLAAVEKAEKERKKYSKRRTQLIYNVSDKYGLQNLLTKRRIGLSASDKETDSAKEVATILPTEETEPVSPDFLAPTFNLQHYTSIEQRHRYPELQAEEYSKMLPIRKALSVKRSQRCKTCDHSLCKPEFIPSSIKFKMLMSAIYHVPEIRLMQPAFVKKGETFTVLLTMTNLSTILTHVVLLPNVEDDGESHYVQADIPLCEFSLPVKDDMAELDEHESEKNLFNDDKSVVVFRAGHKLGFKINAKYEGDGSAWLTFIIKYDYVNLLTVVSAASAEQKEAPEILWLQQKVRVRLSA